MKKDKTTINTSVNRYTTMSEAGHGGYLDVPVEFDDKTIHVKKGEQFSGVYILGGRPGLCDEFLLRHASDNLGFDHIVVEENAVVDVSIIVLPGSGKDFDIPIIVDILGENAEVNCTGVFLTKGSERVSITTNMIHRVANCNSNQLFNGIATDSSKGNFVGKITVAPDAQKTAAYQENHNILLSENAIINTRPQLEIYADDVKCNHGATLGRLNEDEQFYMRTRGIPLEEAKVLQMISFLSPILAHIEDEAQKLFISEEIESAIRSMI